MKDVTYDKFDFQSVKYTAHILLFMIALMFEKNLKNMEFQ